jgi:immunoglobulin-binding protein 1
MATITPEEALEYDIRAGKMATGPGGAASAKKDDEDEDEGIDNEEKLQKARNWDDFKDDNPRGWGNTKR